MPYPTGALNSDNRMYCAKSKSDNYKVVIRSQGYEIVADMPEEFTTAVGSDWENRLPNSLNSIEGLLKAGAGTSATVQITTQQVWVNSSPVEIPITLVFDAVEDAYQEVVKPIRILESMAMPDYVGGFLYAPGPSLWRSGADYGCELFIGRQFHMNNMILVSVSASLATRLDEKGYPIAGRVDCTFRTPKVLSKSEWLEATGIPPRQQI